MEKVKDFQTDDFQIVEGELLEVSSSAEVESFGEEKKNVFSQKREIQKGNQKTTQKENQSAYSKLQTAQKMVYLILPLVFLTVTLLGGVRLSGEANDFLFLKPALVCLVFAAVMLILFFRANLIRVPEWFSEDFSLTTNAANALVLLTLFTASVQIFNALLPERGLPFWVVAFCFFWTLWNNLFAEFDAKKLLKSLGALFAVAFVAKYLILANLIAPANESWLRGIWENPAQETLTYLLDLPRFSAGTGYIQFFTLALYLVGLFLFPQKINESANISVRNHRS